MKRRRVLIVRLGAVGDVISASTLIPAIRATTPDAHITWVCGSSVSRLVALFGVDRLVEVDDVRLFGDSMPRRIAALAGAYRQLAARRFDLAILAHVDRRYRALIWPIFAKRTRQWSRDVRREMNFIPGRTLSNEFARLLEEGGVLKGPVAGHYPLVSVDARLPPATRDIDRSSVVIVPGGARNLLANDSHRRWPVENYSRLAMQLAAEGRRVLLVGDRGDAWVRPAFDGIAVEDLIGVYDLPQTLSLLTRVGVVVTHDTGPLHLARLVRAPLVALFGPTMPTQVVAPNPLVSVVWGGERLACRPCHDGRYFAQCSNHLCMQDISVDDVLRRVRAISPIGAA